MAEMHKTVTFEKCSENELQVSVTVEMITLADYQEMEVRWYIYWVVPSLKMFLDEKTNLYWVVEVAVGNLTRIIC